MRRALECLLLIRFDHRTEVDDRFPALLLASPCLRRATSRDARKIHRTAFPRHRYPKSILVPYPVGAGIPNDLDAFLAPSNLVLLLASSSPYIASVALWASIARAFSAPRSP